MGNSFLSRPITTASSAVESNGKLAYGASSMQGWRVSQEDAHNCILEYDEDTAFFAVYDGHGGSEVALYASEQLPNFLKNLDKYKNGLYEEALIDAFLGFDDTIPAQEILDKLKELRDQEFVKNKADKEEKRRRRLCGADGSVDEGGNEDDEDGSEDEEEFESAEVLRREASRPIEEVVAAYREGKSPCSQSDGAGTSSSAGCSSSSMGASSSSSVGSGAGSSAPETSSAAASSSTRSSPVGSSRAGSSSSAISIAGNAGSSQTSPSISAAASSSKARKNENLANGSTSEEPVMNGGLSNGDISEELKEEKLSKRIPKEPVTTVSDQPSTSPKKKKLAMSDLDDTTVVKNFIANDEISENDEDDSEDETFELSNNDDEDDEDDEDDDSEGRKARGKFMLNRNSLVKQLTRHLRRNRCIIMGDSDDSDDVEEEDEVDNEEEGVDEETETKSGAEEEDEEAEDEEDEDPEEESDDDDGDFDFGDCGEQPGVDSGCTAVVALIKGDKLYVANAGDSRCVICKNGVAVDMSEDHKPEDKIEYDRVKKAGGSVHGGRVEGGLNLSRAIGDHRYKKNTELPNTEQMITALPDVRVAKLESDVEFIVLACDGIWNSLTSQEVVDFIRPRIKSDKSLSDICEELFHECLAPNVMCDGTGCDNMTCIIVKPASGEGSWSAGVVSSSDQRTSSKSGSEEKSAEKASNKDISDDASSTTTATAVEPGTQKPGDKGEQDVAVATAKVSSEETVVGKGQKRPNDSENVVDATNKRCKTEDVTLDDSSCANSSL